MRMIIHSNKVIKLSGVCLKSPFCSCKESYHLVLIDRGQLEVVERDEEAFQLSNQQQQNHTIRKLDGKNTKNFRPHSSRTKSAQGK